MKRCPECGSLRLLSALEGKRAYCARCHRRLSRDYALPMFAAAAQLVRRTEPDPNPAA
jgi:uncharacterized paraquat-inducible protein A